MMFLPNGDPTRRRRPRIIDTDWLVMRGLAKALDGQIDRYVGGGDLVVDFGCGTRPYQPLIEQKGGRYIGADLGDAGDLAISDDGLLAAEDGVADIVTSFQVLEHVRDVDIYLSEARRVLKPDGYLILSTHGTWLYHPHPEDHRRWTREGLYNEIQSRGFEVVDCHPVAGPLAWTTILRLTAYGFVLRRIPVIGRPASACLSLIMNLRAWIEDRLTPSAITKENACIYLTVSRRPA